MKYLVFDNETTGLGQSAEVIQFSGLLLDEKLKLQRLINFYCYTQEEMEPKAFETHKLSHRYLMEQSGGKTFEDYFLELVPKEKDLTWIAYNVSYDMRVINNTLTRNGLPAYNFGKTTALLNKTKGIYNFDLMKIIASIYGHAVKLSVAAQTLPYSEDRINSMYKKLLQLAGMSNETTFHNSLYDVLITWFLLGEHRNLCR